MANTALTMTLLAGLLLLGPLNFILFKVMYASFGARYAFFVSQGINLLYCVYGGLALYPRMLCTSEITPAMRATPHGRFITMGLLDCFGTFLAAMGAVYTPGQYQTVLNQTLIPITILVSRIFLKTRFSPGQLAGAATIMCGAAVTTLVPALSGGDATVGSSAPTAVMGYSSLVVYFLSNVPMACSAVYKEARFSDGVDLHVLYLTQVGEVRCAATAHSFG